MGERVKKRRLHGGRVLLLVIGLGMLYLAALVVRIQFAGWHDERGHADVIIVLGASQANGRPSEVLKGRLQHALTLYAQGYAPYLLFTGGKRPGDNYTEAGTGRRYALAQGVPDGAMLIEPTGATTMQSLQACSAIMRRHGLRRAILVSDPFHTFRLRRIARDLGLSAMVSPTPYSRVRSLPKQAYFTMREVGVYTAYRLLGI
ncbi:MAG TPA: YdcF family protein [Armatimonadota bacterium]|jgi:uncharacterized SAM-binding protein YcdF (DUF218 family)